MAGALTRMLGRMPAAASGNAADPTIAALSPTAWYDPSVLSSVWTGSGGTTPAAVGDPVSKLDDLSGNGNHLVLSGLYPNTCPILRNSGNIYWLEFDNSGRYLDCASVTMTQPNDFAVAVWWDNLGAARHICDGITTRQAVIGNGTNGQMYAGTAVRNAGTIATLTNYKIVSSFNGASSFNRINGSSTTVTLTPGANGLSGLRLGTFSGATGAMYGRIYAFLCRDTVFSAGDTTTVETYLAARM